MQRILITGASSGIGLQLAKDYAAAGADVIACGRNKDKLSEALADYKVTLCVFDTTDRAETLAQLDPIGAVDLAILNAGSCDYIDDARHFDSTPIVNMMSLNVSGTAFCIEALLKHMQSGSRIGIVSSSATFLPLTRAGAYGASKAALNYLADSLAIDLAPHGINISLIRPGFVDTPLTQKNTFAMPGLISMQQCSDTIRNGLQKGKRHIDFPRGFIMVLRLLSILPVSLKHALGVYVAKKSND